MLRNKVAVVTGSGRGIGRSIALAMAKEGANVVVNNRKPDPKGGDANTVAKEITDAGGKAVAFFGDISNFKTAGELIKKATGSFGRIDILVNNAGDRQIMDLWEMPEEEWDKVVDIILKGAFNCTRHALPLMMAQKWGRIINCTSGCWVYCRHSPQYAAAKGGVVSFTRAIAGDVADYNITCNAYHPYARTAMVRSAQASKDLIEGRLKLGLIDKDEYERMQHPPTPEGIGPMIAYLATDQAANITGKVFYVSDNVFSLYSEPVKIKTIQKKQGLWTVEELVNKVPEMMKGIK